MINTISISLSGLNAATKKIEATASNVANLSTVGSLNAEPAPYTPLGTVQTTATGPNGEAQGVRSDFVARPNPFVPAFDPDSPFADENGIIGVPNINLAEEATNLGLAELSFKANIAVIKTAEELSDEVLNIFNEEV